MAANVEIGTNGCVRRHRGEGTGVKQRNRGPAAAVWMLQRRTQPLSARVLPEPTSGAAWLSRSEHMLNGSPHTELAENYHTI